jgi:hypothetical protein
MAHKVIVPPKKNYVPKFLKQRDIDNFMYQSAVIYCCCVLLSVVARSFLNSGTLIVITDTITL